MEAACAKSSKACPVATRPVKERGTNLSSGQRRLLAFARLSWPTRDPDTDEATSSVDPETERLIQQAMASLPGASFIIARRLSTVSGGPDMSSGRQDREQGTHDG